MTTLMLYLGLMMVGAVATIGLAGWASRGDKMRRNIVGFLLAVLGSYAAGFLIDMLGTTFAGELPAANVIAPAFSWLAIAVVATFAAVPPSAGALVLASPFAINAALAFVATVVRSRHLGTAEK